ATPDWILASLGDHNLDGFSGGVPASGDMPNTEDTNAPDWLQQAAAPNAKPKH
ncbi:unnamed protein product, partial [Ectocarpus sp. 12 AP-2014]